MDQTPTRRTGRSRRPRIRDDEITPITARRSPDDEIESKCDLLDLSNFLYSSSSACETLTATVLAPASDEIQGKSGRIIKMLCAHVDCS